MRPQRLRSAATALLAVSLAGILLPASASATTSPYMSVGCFQPSTTPGVALECYASVTGPTSNDPVPTGTFDFTAPSFKGVVSPASCDASSTCMFAYTPKGSGSATRKDTVTATYSGDAVYTSRQATVTVKVTVRPAPGLVAFCAQPYTTPGLALQCSAATYSPGGGAAPTGTLRIKVPTFKGAVTPVACDASGCDFTYVPKGSGTTSRRDTITVMYSGDGVYSSAQASIPVAVPAKPPVSLAVGCGYFTTPGVPVQCDAAIYRQGPGPLPTGTITVTAPTYKGSLSPTTCDVWSPCSFSYTPVGSGSASRKDTVTFTYSGDAFYGAAKQTWTINVLAP